MLTGGPKVFSPLSMSECSGCVSVCRMFARQPGSHAVRQYPVSVSLFAPDETKAVIVSLFCQKKPYNETIRKRKRRCINMKKRALLPMALTLTLACAAGVMAEETAYIPGTYESEAAGFGGAVKVVLTVNDKEITDLIITGDSETPGIGLDALPTLREQLLAAQSEQIDGVSGASVTSNAVREAAATVFALAHGEEPPKTEVQVPEGVVLGENEYYGEDENAMGGKLSLKVTYVDGVIKAITVLEQHEGEL